MFFNRGSATLATLAKVFLLVAITQLGTGCAWLNDHHKDPASFQSPTLDLSCLKVMPAQLQNLFEGKYTASKADQAQAAQIWTCLDKGLSVFSSYTHGANPNYYTAQELELFANRYFPVDHVLTDDFAQAIFRLKRAVLGGTDTQLTQVEISRLRNKLNRFGQIIAPVSANMTILLNPTAANLQDKTRAAAALSAFMVDFADLLADSINDMPWTDLGEFVNQLEKYTSAQGTSDTALTLVREQLPVFQYLKLLLVGGDENLIERDKWHPIFQSISKVYNAIYLAEDSSQMFDDLSIDIQSTEENRRTAVKKITATLNFMKADPNYLSRNTINLFADQWAKALLVSAFLFPNNDGDLAVKSFLGSPAIRKISGVLADELTNITIDTLDSEKVKTIAGNVANLIEQAGLANTTPDGSTSVFSISTFRDYCQQLKPLLADPNLADMLVAGLDTFESGQPILLAKSSDTLTPADFRVLIQKAIDVYLAWSKDFKLSLEESIGETVDVVRRAPSPVIIDANQTYLTLQSLQNFFILGKFKTNIDWNAIKMYVRSGFAAKALLLGDGNSTLSSADLTTLNNVYTPFRKDPDWTANLGEVAKALQSNPFVSAKIEDLANAVDAFLPEGQKLAQLGLDSNTIGYLKLLLIGGDRLTLASSDYSKLASAGDTITKKMLPKIRSLPPKFAFGLNSTSLDVFQTGIATLIAVRPDGFPLPDIEGTILALIQKKALAIRPTTIDKLLIGLNQRVFLNSKGPKPATLSGTLTAKNLSELSDVLELLKDDYADLEKTYQGLAAGATLERTVLLSKLTRDSSLLFVQKTNPELDGLEHWLYFPAAGKKLTAFPQYDLTNKDTYYRGLAWLIPHYMIDGNDSPSNPRLSMGDLTDLIVDVNDCISDFKLSLGQDPPAVTAKKYMQDINLFPLTGNGDSYVDPVESAEFLTMAGGGGVLFDQARKDLVHACYPNVTEVETVARVPIDCLNQNFFNPKYYLNLYSPVIPQYADLYQSLNDAERTNLRIAALTAANASLPGSDHIDIADFQTLVPLPYYLENIFERLDLNGDGLLQFSEAMGGFPLFCESIADAANFKKDNCAPGKNPGLISAVYGYILLNGTPPSKSFFSEIKFLAWAEFKWPYFRNNPAAYDKTIRPLNRVDLLQIISNLSSSTPSTAPAIDPTTLELNDAFFQALPVDVQPELR